MDESTDADLDGLEGEDDGDAGEDEGPLDLTDVDPDAWRPGIPWLPSISLLFALLALPVMSVVLLGPLGNELRVGAPDQLWSLDAWRILITIALVGGAILVAVVPVAARLARRRPGVVFGLLEVGFPIGVIVVTGLVVIHTLLAIAITLAVERLVLGTTITATTVVILIGGVASATYLATSGLGALRPAAAEEPAITLARDQAHGLFASLDDLTARIGVAPPDAVLLGPSMDFWTGTGTFRTLDRNVSGTVIHLSLPQLALLSHAELDGVLAHELAHILHGDTEIGARLSPAFDRMARSIDALDRESTGPGRIAAKPALLWLEFAMDAVGVVVAERRRTSEAAADAVETAMVGPQVAASGLLAGHAIGVLEDDWAEAVGQAMEGSKADPVEAFATQAREILASVTTAQILEQSLEDIGPAHPALITRVRAAGGMDIEFALSDEAALATVIDEPRRITKRLLEALRGPVAEREILRLNEPHVTPGLVGWVLTGIVFGVIFVVRGMLDAGAGGDGPLIVAVISGLWLLFPLVYFWLQRELRIGGGQVRARAWWWRWLDRSGKRHWRRVRWSDELALTIGFEAFMTLSDGTDRIRWWGGIWSKRDVARLEESLAARGARVEGTSGHVGPKDPERHAVVWYAGDRFLVPRVRLTEDDGLVEVLPVSAYPAGMLRLSLSLIDRLDEPVQPATQSDRRVKRVQLAEAARLDQDAFDRDARRLVLDGDAMAWTIRVDGREDEWRLDRSTDEADLTEFIFEVLAIPKSARGRRSGTPSG